MRLPARRSLALILCGAFLWSCMGWFVTPLCQGWEEKDRFDLFCPDIPVVEAVLVAAFQADEQVIFLEQPKGNVNLRREGVTFHQALDLILADSGLSWWTWKGLYMIGEPLPDSPAYARLSRAARVMLSHLESQEIATLLPALDADVRVETPATLLVYGPPHARHEAVRLISELDRPREHIRMSVLVAEMDSHDASDFSIDFRARETADGIPFGERDSIGGSFERLARIEAELRALETAGKATVKGRHDLTVVEGEEGMAWAGTDLYYRLETDTPAGVTVTVERVEVGTGVVLKPWWVGSEEMQVTVEVTSQDLRPTPTYPAVVNRMTSTTARVRPGEVTLLGGLTWSERQVGGPLLTQADDTATPPHGKEITEGELLVFIEAAPADADRLPPVLAVRGEDAFIDSLTHRERVSEFEYSVHASIAALPAAGNVARLWAGGSVTGYIGEELRLGGRLSRALDENYWYGVLESHYAFEDSVAVGLEIRTLQGTASQTMFTGFLEERWELENSFDLLLRLGFSASDTASLGFASAGIELTEKDFTLCGEVKHLWNEQGSNWWGKMEGRFILDNNISFAAGFREILGGKPIEPFDSMEFRGGYLEVGYQF